MRVIGWSGRGLIKEGFQVEVALALAGERDGARPVERAEEALLLLRLVVPRVVVQHGDGVRHRLRSEVVPEEDVRFCKVGTLFSVGYNGFCIPASTFVSFGDTVEVHIFDVFHLVSRVVEVVNESTFVSKRADLAFDVQRTGLRFVISRFDIVYMFDRQGLF